MELWTTHVPHPHEVCLLFLLFGAVLLHRLPEIEQQFGWSLPLENFAIHAGISLVALAIPGAIALLAQACIRWLNPTCKPRSFVELAYSYLPFVLGANLAHYLRLGLTEAGRIIPVTFATFGFGTANLPVAVADPAVIAFLQAVALIVSFWLSVFLVQKIARLPLRKMLPQHLALAAIGVLIWKVVVGW
jgi:hypothetical protein